MYTSKPVDARRMIRRGDWTKKYCSGECIGRGLFIIPIRDISAVFPKQETLDFLRRNLTHYSVQCRCETESKQRYATWYIRCYMCIRSHYSVQCIYAIAGLRNWKSMKFTQNSDNSMKTPFFQGFWLSPKQHNSNLKIWESTWWKQGYHETARSAISLQHIYYSILVIENFDSLILSRT